MMPARLADDDAPLGHVVCSSCGQYGPRARRGRLWCRACKWRKHKASQSRRSPEKIAADRERSLRANQAYWSDPEKRARQLRLARERRKAAGAEGLLWQSWVARAVKYRVGAGTLMSMWLQGGPPANVPCGCWVCGRALVDRPNAGRGDVLCVDHNHETGRVRGILCIQCNLTVQDHSAERLITAARYVALSED